MNLLKSFMTVAALCFVFNGFANQEYSNPANVVQEAMNFPMGPVLARYKKDFNVSDETAKNHEVELKRYLVLCSLYPEAQFNMFSEQVDNLWHTFIMFTKDYNAFCKRIANKFLHHSPHDESEVASQEYLENNYHMFSEQYINLFKEEPSSVWGKEKDKCKNTETCWGCQVTCMVS
jgi:hypothetical protein